MILRVKFVDSYDNITANRYPFFDLGISTQKRFADSFPISNFWAMLEISWRLFGLDLLTSQSKISF